jgi:hypothetical protein
MLTFRFVELVTVVAPLVEPVELVDVLEPLDVEPPVEAVELEPDEGEVDGAPPEPLLPEVLDVPELDEVEPPVVDVVEPPLLASTLVTTNASAANDTCLALNKAIWPVVAP